jgi:hypothetical protein
MGRYEIYTCAYSQPEFEHVGNCSLLSGRYMGRKGRSARRYGLWLGFAWHAGRLQCTLAGPCTLAAVAGLSRCSQSSTPAVQASSALHQFAYKGCSCQHHMRLTQY